MGKKPASRPKQQPATEAKPVAKGGSGLFAFVMVLLATTSIAIGTTSAMCAAKDPAVERALGSKNAQAVCQTALSSAARARDFVSEATDVATEAVGGDKVVKDITKQASDIWAKVSAKVSEGHAAAFKALGLPVDDPKTEAPRHFILLVIFLIFVMPMLVVIFPLLPLLFLLGLYIAVFPGVAIQWSEFCHKEIAILTPFFTKIVGQLKDIGKMF
eukprot:TRINITY_DN54579_c0_g1_i1.p1 TRINITY_DN54579_c0_g1~~TRINITY_DN54579_c0_g1_i1.p1  ORF type:complete len:215 (+),score=87.16 TRINITY_DN54579_c0_g1_i1:63-707(+)